jgi:hypothetical protein
MTSQINPNNIDGTYPIAGQDNNSQGFRDNFTQTRVNFQAAADEISELQSKVLLKSALTGTTLDNDMQTSLIVCCSKYKILVCCTKVALLHQSQALLTSELCFSTLSNLQHSHSRQCGPSIY